MTCRVPQPKVRLATAIRGVDRRHLIAFEPDAVRNVLNRAPVPDHPFAVPGGLYAPHIYTDVFDGHDYSSGDPAELAPSMERAAAEAAAWGTPLLPRLPPRCVDKRRGRGVNGGVNGIHDLGGMDGFGRVVREVDEPVFHAAWEGRVFAIASLLLGRGVTNLDAFRHAIERLPPAVYLTAGYYGRWLEAVGRLLVENGIATADELRRGAADPGATPPARRPVPPAGALREVGRAPRFAVGERVAARNVHPAGHTRLPRYVRGKRGVVARVHPAWVFPDSNAHGRGEEPQHVYAVRFAARELWGEGADPGVAVHVDVFESHLEPAD